jgi:hypothetical protein
MNTLFDLIQSIPSERGHRASRIESSRFLWTGMGLRMGWLGGRDDFRNYLIHAA